MAVKATDWVNPLLALVVARAQAGWNQTARETGAVGKGAAVALFVLVLIALAPFTLGLLGAGAAFGEKLPASPEAAQAVGAIYLGLAVGLGLASGLFSPLRFRDEGLRAFPVPASVLLVLELLAGSLSLTTLFALAGFLGLGAGLCFRQPLLSLFVLHFVAQGALTTLLVAQLATSAKRALLKKLSGLQLAGLGALWLAAVVVYFWSHAGAPRPGPAEVAAAGRAWGTVVARFPSGLAALGLGALARGEPWRGLWPQAWLFLSNALLFAAAALAHEREQGLEARTPAAAEEARVFTFGTRPGGIAQLFVLQLWSSKFGKLALLGPLFVSLMMVFVLRGFPALGKAEGELLRALLKEVPAGFPALFVFVAYAVAGNSELFFNQFGLDRAGVRTLFLLPISPADLVLGKLRGLAVIILLQLGLALGPLLFIGVPGPLAVAEALGGGVAVFCGMFAIGLRLSVRFPRKAWAAGEGTGGGVPLTLGVYYLLAIAAAVALPALCCWLLGGLRPVALLALGAVSVAATARMLPGHAAALVRSQERLVEGLG